MIATSKEKLNSIWFWVWGRRKAHSVESVFTPSQPARVNFVERPHLARQIEDALRTPGQQLAVYGETGTGKSTLLLNILDGVYGEGGYITTSCNEGSSFEDLMLDAFDQLDPYYVEERTRTRSRQMSSSAAAEYALVRASAATTETATSGVTDRRLLPPQLNPRRLGGLMGAQGLCWLLEDFHKLEVAHKRSFAQALKTFSDLSERYRTFKVVATGATASAREVIQYEPEMANRVAEIHVPLMSGDEIGTLISQGESLLNVTMTEVRAPLIKYSVGVAGVCHQLALNMCRNAGVLATRRKRHHFAPDDMKEAAQRWAAESRDSIKATFAKALRRSRVRRYDNGRLILQALATGPLEGMTHAEVLSEIRRSEPDYPSGNLTSYLRELMKEERGALVRSNDEGGFRFVDPLHHTYAQMTLGETPIPPREDSFYAYVAEYLAQLLEEADGPPHPD